MPEKKRKALIVGVNSYDDAEIHDLQGAETDAKELYERLCNPEIGNFEIEPHHFLVGPQATCEGIRTAISELLLLDQDHCELVLLYFSGHGFVDGYGDGYIAPCNFARKNPYANGINMSDLKTLASRAVNKDCVLTILDCCYSGISTAGDRDVPDVGTKYDAQLQEISGEGRIILASSESNQVSKESEYTHSEAQEPHHHGAFSYYLIEALDGRASSDAEGRVSLDNLWKFVEEGVQKEGKQKPNLYAAAANSMDKIFIGFSQKVFQNAIAGKLEQAEGLLNQDVPANLINIVELVHGVLDLSPTNQRAVNIRDQVDEYLRVYVIPVQGWVFENKIDVEPHVPNTYQDLETLTRVLNFDAVSTLSKRRKTLLAFLCEVSTERREKDTFMEYCRYLEKQLPTTSGLSNPSGLRRPGL